VWLTTEADDQSSLMRAEYEHELLGRSAILHAFMLGAESDVYTILIITANIRENVCNNSKNVKSHVFLNSEKNKKT